MKKKNVLIFMFAFVFMVLCFQFPNKTTAKAEEKFILTSPTQIVAIEDSIFVADKTTGKLVKYAKDITPSSQGVQPLATIELTDIKTLEACQNGIVVLTQNASSSKLYLIDTNLSSVSEITFELDYSSSLAKVVDIAIKDSTFYALRDSGDIDQFTFISSTKLSLAGTHSKQNYMSEQQNQIIGIDIIDGNFSFKTTTESYFLAIPGLTKQLKLQLSENETFVFSSGKYAITSSGNIVDASVAGSSVIFTYEGNPSGFFATGNEIYITDSLNHSICLVDAENKTITDLQINEEILLNNLSPENYIQIKVNEVTPLYNQPYSITPTLSVNVHTNLNVIATYNNYYYCLVIENGENHFLFLNTTTSNFEVIEVGLKETIYTAITACHIYSLPTTLDNNLSLGSISPGQEITVASLTTISNSKGELFYLIKYNETYGFVRSTFFQSTKGAVELTTPCNAKIKRATTLFENADGTGSILSLEKGTRVALLEEISPTKQYVLAEYQDTDGIVYKGYIFTEDIAKDGLSTLQILGLVLVGSNIILLTIILLIKKQSRKWEVSSPDKDDVPSVE